MSHLKGKIAPGLVAGISSAALAVALFAPGAVSAQTVDLHRSCGLQDNGVATQTAGLGGGTATTGGDATACANQAADQDANASARNSSDQDARNSNRADLDQSANTRQSQDQSNSNDANTRIDQDQSARQSNGDVRQSNDADVRAESTAKSFAISGAADATGPFAIVHTDVDQGGNASIHGDATAQIALKTHEALVMIMICSVSG